MTPNNEQLKNRLECRVLINHLLKYFPPSEEITLLICELTTREEFGISWKDLLSKWNRATNTQLTYPPIPPRKESMIKIEEKGTKTYFRADWGIGITDTRDNGTIWLSMIRVNIVDRNQKHGTDLLLKIIDHFKGKTILLEPIGTGDMGDNDLTSWYERSGFRMCSQEEALKLAEELKVNLCMDTLMILDKPT